jgi:hypothetical protein
MLRALYALSLILAVAAGVTFVSSRSWTFADDCCQSNICAWRTQPTATDADAQGAFNTATDSDDNEPTIEWCLTFEPIAGTVVIADTGNVNVTGVTYTPSGFSIAHCSGSQEVAISGSLSNPSSDGTVNSKAIIGPFPNSCVAFKSLAVNAD